MSDELRRRRTASYRCEPLPCGRRDVLDPHGRQIDREAALAAWWHLRDAGLMSEVVEAVLREAA